MIRNFLKINPYTLPNNVDSAKDGPWTWVLRSRKKTKTISTNVFPVKGVMASLPRRKEETIAETNWKLGKPEG